jgi:hypothetical protein
MRPSLSDLMGGDHWTYPELDEVRRDPGLCGDHTEQTNEEAEE